MIDLNAQSILKIEGSVAQNPRASWWALNCALSLRMQVPLGKKRVKKSWTAAISECSVRPHRQRKNKTVHCQAACNVDHATNHMHVAIRKERIAH
jgi:hypothetical protein